MHLIILINQGSGTRSKMNFLKEISCQCFEKGWSYEVRSSWYVNNPDNVKYISKQRDSLVIICGGDGTINKVIRAFWQQKLLSKVRFLVYPGGTFNALIKNLNFNSNSIQKLAKTIERGETIATDLLEITLRKGKKSRKELFHTGVLFVKDCSFTQHAADIQKALQQFDLRLGVQSIKKSLPYLDKIPSFVHIENNKRREVQGLYIANNPYLITKRPIHPNVKINDSHLHIFYLESTDFFQIGQIASVLLLGSQRKLAFLKEEKRKKISFELQEDVDMNLDGDVEKVQKDTKVEIRVSSQKFNLIKYL